MICSQIVADRTGNSTLQFQTESSFPLFISWISQGWTNFSAEASSESGCACARSVSISLDQSSVSVSISFLRSAFRRPAVIGFAGQRQRRLWGQESCECHDEWLSCEDLRPKTRKLRPLIFFVFSRVLVFTKTKTKTKSRKLWPETKTRKLMPPYISFLFNCIFGKIFVGKHKD